MDITFDAAHCARHFEQILQLQERNLLGTVDGAELATQGFVYVRHTRALLETMAAGLPQVVALFDGTVVGYNLAMHASMRRILPQLEPMFAQFERTRYRDTPLAAYRYMVGGQVCVDRRFRGRGLLRRLYHETRRRLPPGYELCVTEVSERNAVSLNAHLRMGFEVIGTYHDSSETWNIVAWDLARATDVRR